VAQITNPIRTVRKPARPLINWSDRILLTAPMVLIIGILWFSPNFDSQAHDRRTPFGGDFLQEWIGGTIVLSENRSRLYDLEYFSSLQHEPQLVGFSWTESQYYPAIYPPFYYLLVSPFSALEYRQAVVLWCILSAAALIASGALLLRYYPPASQFFMLGFVLATIFAPTINCLNIGHKSTFLLLILTCTFLLYYHKRAGWAGVVFGLVAFKPHFALTLWLMMLATRRWRFVLGAMGTVSMLVLLSILTGPDLCVDYFNLCLQTGSYLQTGGYLLSDAHCLWGAVHNAMPSQSEFSVNVVTGVLSVLIIGLLVFILKGQFGPKSNGFAVQFAAMVLATVILSPHLYFYDLTITLLPMVLIWFAARNVPLEYRKHARVLALLILVVLFGAGAFRDVAEATRIQPSVGLFVIMLINLAIIMHGQRKLTPPLNRKVVKLCPAERDWGQCVPVGEP
jgi:hypothetical protein